MSIYTALHNLAVEWNCAREEARTRRLVAALPVEIQKDIGWPTSVVARAESRKSGSRH